MFSHSYNSALSANVTSSSRIALGNLLKYLPPISSHSVNFLQRKCFYSLKSLVIMIYTSYTTGYNDMTNGI